MRLSKDVIVFFALAMIVLALIITFPKTGEKSIVSVEMKNKSNIFSIKNTGNAPLKIEIYESNESISKITGAIILNVKEQLMTEVKNPTIFVARQNE